MFAPDLEDELKVLWDLNTWSLIIVQGPRWVSGNRRFMETHVLTSAVHWPERLNFSDPQKAFAWLESPVSETRPYVGKIEGGTEGISLFDTETNILYESPSNKRIHRYESWEMEGKNLFDFCHEVDLARSLPRFEHLGKTPGIDLPSCF